MSKSSKIHWHAGCRFGRGITSPDISAGRFNSDATKNADWFCLICAKAARLALAKESAPTPRPARSCSNCRSGAINPGHHGRDESTDLDLCDVCYWRKRAQPAPRPIAEASYPSRVLAWFPSLSGWRIVRAGWPVHESNGYHLPTHFLPLPPSPEVK